MKGNHALIILGLVFLLVISLSSAYGQPVSFTLDFETGDLRGWTKTGKAFDYQPTFGDNPTARHRGQPSGHQGKYWVGTFEKYQGRQSGQSLNLTHLPLARPGDAQGDRPQGMLTSAPFAIPRGKLTFLVGGGSSFQTRVELLIQDPIEGSIRALHASGRDSETMQRVVWNLDPFAGRTGRIRIVDASSKGWGHINVDDFQFSPAPVPERPVARIRPENIRVFQGEMVVFESLSTPAGKIQEIWTGPGGQRARGGHFEVSTDRLSPGRYEIVLAVTDRREQADRAIAVLEVIPLPVGYRVGIQADRHRVEQNQPVRFSASLTPYLEGAEYRFDFGDSRTAWTGESETEHRYSTEGLYQASVAVRREGRIIAESRPVQIEVFAPADFRVFLKAEPERTETGRTVIFRAGLEPYAEGAEYRFVFGDGLATDWSGEAVAEHQYSEPGDYEATVEVRLDQVGISKGNHILIRIEEHSQVIPWEWLIPGILAGLGAGYFLKKTLSRKTPSVRISPRKDGGIQQVASGSPIRSDLEVRLRPVPDRGRQAIEAEGSLIMEEGRRHE